MTHFVTMYHNLCDSHVGQWTKRATSLAPAWLGCVVALKIDFFSFVRKKVSMPFPSLPTLSVAQQLFQVWYCWLSNWKTTCIAHNFPPEISKSYCEKSQQINAKRNVIFINEKFSFSRARSCQFVWQLRSNYLCATTNCHNTTVSVERIFERIIRCKIHTKYRNCCA